MGEGGKRGEGRTDEVDDREQRTQVDQLKGVLSRRFRSSRQAEAQVLELEEQADVAGRSVSELEARLEAAALQLERQGAMQQRGHEEALAVERHKATGGGQGMCLGV